MCLSAFLNGQYRLQRGGGEVMAVNRCKTVSNAGIGWGNPLPGFFYVVISVYCKDTVSCDFGLVFFSSKDAPGQIFINMKKETYQSRKRHPWITHATIYYI